LLWECAREGVLRGSWNLGTASVSLQTDLIIKPWNR